MIIECTCTVRVGEELLLGIIDCLLTRRNENYLTVTDGRSVNKRRIVRTRHRLRAIAIRPVCAPSARASYQEQHRISQRTVLILFTVFLNFTTICGISCRAPALRAPLKEKKRKKESKQAPPSLSIALLCGSCYRAFSTRSRYLSPVRIQFFSITK